MEPEGLKLRPICTKQPHEGTTNGSVYTDINEPVTPAGRVFCSPSFNVHIMVTLGSKIPIAMDEFKKGILETLLKHKRFCSVIRKGSKGEMYWVPTTVNLDDHIVVVEGHDSPSFVDDYVAKLMQASPLDMAKPLFEFHIIRAKLGDAVENVVFRVHHSLGDGTSLMSLFLACTRKVSQVDSLPTLPTRASRKETIVKAAVWVRVFLTIWRFLVIFWYTFLDMCVFTATILWLEDSQTPLKGSAGVEKSSRRLAHKTISMEDIRPVKQAIHGTVNDVLYGMVAAGLSRYLQQCYDDDNMGNSNNVNIRGSKHKDKSDWTKMQVGRLRIRACALINTRPTPGLQELEHMMRGGSQARWGNDMGYVLMRVPLSAFEDPLDYAREAKSIMDKKKMSLGALLSYKSGKMLMNLTGPKLPTRLTYKCTLNTTLAFSNVFGPLEEIQFFGHPITHIIPTVGGHPQALCVHVQSYMGKVTIVVSSAKDIIPDPENLCNQIVCALMDMKLRIAEIGL